jgi:DNA mismatch endonuclease (patch repair protein)
LTFHHLAAEAAATIAPKCYTRPKTNRAFWDRKRETNMARDRRVTRQRLGRGWKVIRTWQHSLKNTPA